MADPSTLAAALNYYGNSRLKRREFDGGEPPTIEGLGEQWQGVSDAIQAGPDNARRWLEKEPGYTYSTGPVVWSKHDQDGKSSGAIPDMFRNPLIGALDLMQMKMARDESGKPVGLTDPGLEAMATAMVPWGGGGINKGYLRSGGGPVEKPGIRAYHGSPHDFDAFDASKIGTGEGAQAYGHGMYFAENEGVARSYRDALTGTSKFGNGFTVPMSLDGAPVTSRNYVNVMDSMAKNGDDVGAALARILGDANRYNSQNPAQIKKLYAGDRPTLYRPSGISPETWDDAWGQFKSRVKMAPPKGRMYEVNIKSDPDRFLDWDKPLGEQKLSSEAIDSVLMRAPQAPPGRGESFGPYTLNELREYGATGRDLYDRLSWATGKPGAFPEINVGTPSGASAALKDAGIPGIKYLDQGSRAGGVGSSNYVVFDPATIEILRKYGLLGMIGGGAAAAGAQPDAGQTYD